MVDSEKVTSLNNIDLKAQKLLSIMSINDYIYNICIIINAFGEAIEHIYLSGYKNKRK
jgi:hypothetical protein